MAKLSPKKASSSKVDTPLNRLKEELGRKLQQLNSNSSPNSKKNSPKTLSPSAKLPKNAKNSIARAPKMLEKENLVNFVVDDNQHDQPMSLPISNNGHSDR